MLHLTRSVQYSAQYSAVLCTYSSQAVDNRSQQTQGCCNIVAGADGACQVAWSQVLVSGAVDCIQILSEHIFCCIKYFCCDTTEHWTEGPAAAPSVTLPSGSGRCWAERDSYKFMLTPSTPSIHHPPPHHTCCCDPASTSSEWFNTFDGYNSINDHIKGQRHTFILCIEYLPSSYVYDKILFELFLVYVAYTVPEFWI